ncbi:MAG: hypothetical protein A2020_02250 [Lentisphaerae bacterium GWF2_45_14]|nr:MAG: hypothetical protein A2020_02250 [Lentisphaerae bacterium GWF2_45_14]
MDSFELKIEKTAFGGAGVGRLNGKVVFVRGTIPGETVRAFIHSEKKDYISGKLMEVIEASPSRNEPTCPFALRPVRSGTTDSFCPGCSYQHMSYERELAEKYLQFSEIFSRFAGLDVTNVMEQPAASKPFMGYRNKLTFHTNIERGIVNLGYFMEDNQTVLDIPQCPLARKEINDELLKLRANPGFFHTLKDGMTFTIRYTENDGVIYWRNKPGIKLKYLRENTEAGTISVPPGSFFQVNRFCMDILIKKVLGIINKTQPDNVIDIYCGAGLFSIAAASGINGKVTGIDCDDETIKAASFNAKKLGSSKCKFISSRADKVIRDFLNGKNREGRTLLITDPPRAGLDAKTLDAVALGGPKGIIYISCAPDTLCRDLKYLLSADYEIISTQLVDMFPRTSHFESITYLERK